MDTGYSYHFRGHMKDEDRFSLLQIIDMMVRDKTSIELQKLVLDLPEDTEQANGEFCDKFGMDWFYEALILHDIDIHEELEHIKTERLNEEAMAQVDLREIANSYQ